MAEAVPTLPEDQAFEDRNPFLDLLLGVISLSERTLATAIDLAEPLPPARIRTPPPQSPPAGPILR